jgi:hypothetical protein
MLARFHAAACEQRTGREQRQKQRTDAHGEEKEREGAASSTTPMTP